MASEIALFLQQALRQPRQISAILPSSRVLAGAIAAQIPADGAPVAEFGPGTGRITEAVLAHGIRPADLTLYEMNPEFCTHLREDFPGVRVENLPAQEVVRQGAGRLGTVVSGLPLLSMPPAVRRDIVEAAFVALRPGGRYVQFTYGSRPPVPDEIADEMGLVARLGARVWRNVPPARVFVYRRRSEAEAA